MDIADDNALVERLRAGDAQAFDAVVRAWSPRLYGFLLRLSGRREEAADLLQETWLKLSVEACRLKSGTVLQAWLFTVARNAFYSHRRWALLDVGRLAELALGRLGAREERTPEVQSAATQEARATALALEQLSAPAREALLLVGVEHLEPSQAAAVVGITPEAFRQRLSRARAQLRALLQPGATP